ncbi:hypothetical protein J437_LFUL015933 [Ladona fulva]|uniref:Lipase domain-containing protein n=1 Tax=Ladona fulva TaxID=123851 RepID=A0A8K0K0F8_LADFU|nr:hypothetical protein J437_LFUL015933 [Ladona fulva]
MEALNMELLRILLFLTVTVTLESCVNGGTIKYPTVMYFPDGKGDLRPGIIYEGPTKVLPINEAEDIKFFLYTRGASYQLLVGDVATLNASSYDSNYPTYIVTHGYQSSGASDTIQDIKDAYLSRSQCNVIGVDWSVIADNILYPVAKQHTVDVGIYVAKFIDFLATAGNLDISTLHLTGHSLGAHVMGIAGKNVKNGKVRRITGMDPAGPLFNLEEVNERLAVGDASFVDIIHTCAGLYGFEDPLGDVDFYPNGGHPRQPGCSIILAGVCSHSRSWQFFAESVNTDKFLAVPCGSYDDFKNGTCDSEPKVPMGEPAFSSARGRYYLNTGQEPPYALG